MKTKYLLFLVITLTGWLNFNEAAAQQNTNLSGIFPIATNANVVEVPGGFAKANNSSGSIAAILAGTNVCYQIILKGTLSGPLTIIGSGTSLPLVVFGGGNYLVYWDDDFISTGPSVYGQIISPTGAQIGSPFFIPAGGNGAPRAVASDGTNFLAVMEDNNNYYGQIVTSSGVLSGSQFLISSQPQNGNSAAAIFGKTNYLVVWQSNNNNTGNDNKTYGEFISSGGIAGSPFQINGQNSLDQNPLAIGFDGTNYLVIWNVDTNLTASGAPIWSLYGRLVSQAGTFPGNELVLNTNQALFPSVAFDGANYLLCWSYNLDTSNANKNVFFQFLNPSASPIGPAFTIFQAEGTNAPLVGTVLVNNNDSKIRIGVGLGVLQVAGDGSIEGFLSGQTYGCNIPASTVLPALMAGNLAGIQFPLQLDGTPGINYTIQTSTNLALSKWTSLITNSPSPTNGTFNFTDTHATNQNRFYRAAAQ